MLRSSVMVATILLGCTPGNFVFRDDAATSIDGSDVTMIGDGSNDLGNECPAPSQRCSSDDAGPVCVDLMNNDLHCGACGNACNPIANGTGKCTMGECLAASCEAGFHPVGKACVRDGGVRPIQPMSLGSTTLLRPTLRFELPTGADGAVVELCADRACMMVIERLSVTGSSARPSMPLEARKVIFWRARARVGGAEDSMMHNGPTWIFRTPARDNANNIDTSHSPHLDVNGDGFDDIAVGAPSASPDGRGNAGLVYVYLGSESGISNIPHRIFAGLAATDLLGFSVSNAGDVNGDGFADLVVGAPEASPSGRTAAGIARVYLGSESGLGAMPDLVLEGQTPGEKFGFSVANAGDVNSDGFADLVVGAPEASPSGRTGAGLARVFLGGATGVRRTPQRVLEGAERFDLLAWSVSSAGDVNGDGFSDIVLGAPYTSPGGQRNAGAAYVFLGSSSGILDTAHRVIEGTTDDELGLSVADAGDVNGDGFTDLVIGAPSASPGGQRNAGSARIYLGSSSGVSAMSHRVIDGPGAGSKFGTSVAGAGDVNGDGFDDVIVGAPSASPIMLSQAGIAMVFYGSESGLTTMVPMPDAGLTMRPPSILIGAMADHRFGYAVAGAGDVNGDKYAEIIVGAPHASPGGHMNAGTVSLFDGRMAVISSMPSMVLEGGSAMERFGLSLAGM